MHSHIPHTNGQTHATMLANEEGEGEAPVDSGKAEEVEEEKQTTEGTDIHSEDGYVCVFSPPLYTCVLISLCLSPSALAVCVSSTLALRLHTCKAEGVEERNRLKRATSAMRMGMCACTHPLLCIELPQLYVLWRTSPFSSCTLLYTRHCIARWLWLRVRHWQGEGRGGGGAD